MGSGRAPGVVARAARFAGVAALAATLLGFAGAQPATAQDDNPIVLTAGGSTLTVSPGHASAVSAVAEAHASPGHAETIAAAARAEADCVDGAITEAAAARAVAHPDQGALTESLASQLIAEARSQWEDDSPFRRDVEHLCGKEEKKAPPKPGPEPAPAPEVVQVPVTGTGLAGGQALSTLFAAASAAATFGAVAFRRRDMAFSVASDR